jgi:hypothetical protein
VEPAGAAGAVAAAAATAEVAQLSAAAEMGDQIATGLHMGIY